MLEQRPGRQLRPILGSLVPVSQQWNRYWTVSFPNSLIAGKKIHFQCSQRDINSTLGAVTLMKWWKWRSMMQFLAKATHCQVRLGWTRIESTRDRTRFDAVRDMESSISGKTVLSWRLGHQNVQNAFQYEINESVSYKLSSMSTFTYEGNLDLQIISYARLGVH